MNKEIADHTPDPRPQALLSAAALDHLKSEMDFHEQFRPQMSVPITTLRALVQAASAAQGYVTPVDQFIAENRLTQTKE